MAMLETKRPRGLRLHDLVGLVVGYGMAALLARSFWPGSRPLEGVPAVALALEFLWLGLAMSGPILLLLDRRGGSSPGLTLRPKRPSHPGRLISSHSMARWSIVFASALVCFDGCHQQSRPRKK